MKKFKNAFKKAFLEGAGLALGFFSTVALLAATVAGTINTFSPGDELDATKINENFSALKSAIETINPQYSNSEVATDSKWIDGKTIYRKVIDIGTLPNSTVKLIAHNVTGSVNFLSATGFSTNGTRVVNLPHASAVANTNIDVQIDATNVIITTAVDWSPDSGTIILEYTRN